MEYGLTDAKGISEAIHLDDDYRRISNIMRAKSHKLHYFLSRPAVAFAQSIEARCLVESKDVVVRALTSEWSTILLPTKMKLIL